MTTLFDGPHLSHNDDVRLGRCLAAVRDIMADGHWTELPPPPKARKGASK